MTPFTPPTDNLYKFLAIGGLAIFFFSIVYLDVAFKQWATDSRETKRLEALYDEEKSSYDIQNKHLSDAADNQKKINDILLKNNETPAYLLGTEKYQNLVSEFLKQSHEHNKDLIDSANRLGHSRDMEYMENDDLTIVKMACYVGAIIGGFATAFGFDSWYRKVQVYQDYLLERDAKAKGYVKPQMFGRRWIRHKRNMKLIKRLKDGTYGKVTPPKE